MVKLQTLEALVEEGEQHAWFSRQPCRTCW
jgi:hypothetical protein